MELGPLRMKLNEISTLNMVIFGNEILLKMAAANMAAILTKPQCVNSSGAGSIYKGIGAFLTTVSADGLRSEAINQHVQWWRESQTWWFSQFVWLLMATNMTWVFSRFISLMVTNITCLTTIFNRPTIAHCTSGANLGVAYVSQWTESLFRVMACCAPMDYLNQCCLMAKWTPRNKLQRRLNKKWICSPSKCIGIRPLHNVGYFVWPQYINTVHHNAPSQLFGCGSTKLVCSLSWL